MAKGKTYIEAKNISKSFAVRDGEVNVLKKINLVIKEGEFVIIFGPSGCGKSTMLHTLLGLEPPSGGNVIMEGKDYYAMTEDERALYRRFNFGIIYQQPLWISSLDVKDNVAFTLNLMDLEKPAIDKKVTERLTLVGMEKWADYRPMELSSGQQQKISLARAMALDPILIVADEPTGNLDTVSGQELINTFKKVNESGKTIIMVTHDLEYLRFGTHLVHMVDGEIVEEMYEDEIKKLHSVKGKRGGGTGDNASVSVTGTEDINVRDKDFLKKS